MYFNKRLTFRGQLTPCSFQSRGSLYPSAQRLFQCCQGDGKTALLTKVLRDCFPNFSQPLIFAQLSGFLFCFVLFFWCCHFLILLGDVKGMLINNSQDLHFFLKESLNVLGLKTLGICARPGMPPGMPPGMANKCAHTGNDSYSLTFAWQMVIIKTMLISEASK